MALDIVSVGPSLTHQQGDAIHFGPSPYATQAPKVDVPKPEPLIPSDLQQTIRDMERLSAAFNRHLSFSVNQKLDSIIVKVVDSKTDKVVREIPPAELQHVYEAIRETIGLLFDSEA